MMNKNKKGVELITLTLCAWARPGQNEGCWDGLHPEATARQQSENSDETGLDIKKYAYYCVNVLSPI